MASAECTATHSENACSATELGQEDTALTALTAQGPLWPAPLNEAALHGLAGDFVRTIGPHTEADDAALLIQFLVAIGNAIGRNPHFTTEADRQHTNLYAVLVGKSSKGRKGTSHSQVMRAFELVGTDAIGGWLANCQASGLSSGEGLIWAVRDPVIQQQAIKNKGGKVEGYQEVIQDPGLDDKRLLVTESEFASVLKHLGRETNTLSPVVRDAWDRGNLRSMVKNSPARATNAHVSIIAHITAIELKRLLTATEAANGFGNRFLWVCVQRSKVLPEGGNLSAASLAEISTRLADVLRDAPEVGEMSRDEEARELWYAVYPDLSDDRYGLFGAVTTRAEAQVARLSCVYALLDNSPVVKLPHLRAALAVWSYCEQSARHIFGDSLGDPLADDILLTLRETHPGEMSRTDLRNKFQRHKSSAEVGRALQLLRGAKLADFRAEPTNGRPAEIWFYTGGMAL